MQTRPMKGGCVLNWNLRMKLLTVVGIIALLITGCGTSNAPAPKLIVGALHVGSIHDLGYNEAMHEGLVEMQKNIPGIKLVEAENVPESADAERVMENMIQQGAKLIFAMSFGYLQPALNVAKRHPE